MYASRASELHTFRAEMGPTTLAIDKTVRLGINGSDQRIRLCGERAGLPPILIVQAGPGLPLLHEVGKFRRRLRLESDFLVGYWEQRGCGVASQEDAKSVSLLRQADDLRAVLRWLFDETEQSVIVFGVSLGGTIALQAVPRMNRRLQRRSSRYRLMRVLPGAMLTPTHFCNDRALSQTGAACAEG